MKIQILHVKDGRTYHLLYKNDLKIYTGGFGSYNHFQTKVMLSKCLLDSSYNNILIENY